ncbi:MAG: acetyl-CoA carboxylase carboxyltransferase subunit alpha [Alphaproteobacteria bacterium]|nr:acetyl-CoA carboxylase carboxyltransferase subunit alpha [Alphaproteobacteria bacterium]
MQYLDFEQTLMEVDSKIEALKVSQAQRGINVAAEMERLTAKRLRVLKQAYKNLTPWQKAGVARHENRPHTLDYIGAIFTDFCALSGDRAFADDPAVIGGFAKLNGRTVMVIGHEKGHDTDSRLYHNFGMARPEGYRKAIRLMKLAEQFAVPVITLVDTAGAYPGMDAEERGQGQAIALCTETCLDLRVPLVSCIIGEGGSGGAIAFAAGNTVLMLQNAIYSVISPEGCASILWKDFKYAPKAAEILHLTADDLLKLKLIDEVIPEPIGGAHHFPQETMKAVAEVLDRYMIKWAETPADDLVRLRHEKFLNMTKLGEK